MFFNFLSRSTIHIPSPCSALKKKMFAILTTELVIYNIFLTEVSNSFLLLFRALLHLGFAFGALYHVPSLSSQSLPLPHTHTLPPY